MAAVVESRRWRFLDSLPAPAVGEVKAWDSLGEYGAVTVDQARDRAKKFLGRVAHGEDSAAERANERAAPTFAELA